MRGYNFFFVFSRLPKPSCNKVLQPSPLTFAKPECDNVLQFEPRNSEGCNTLLYEGLGKR